jgi:hypothetical protein
MVAERKGPVHPTRACWPTWAAKVMGMDNYVIAGPQQWAFPRAASLITSCMATLQPVP